MGFDMVFKMKWESWESSKHLYCTDLVVKRIMVELRAAKPHIY